MTDERSRSADRAVNVDDELPTELSALLRDGATGPPVSDAARARVLGRVLATVGVVAATGTAASTMASSPAATATATTPMTTATMTATAAAGGSLLGKGTLALAVALGVVGTGFIVRRPTPVVVASPSPSPSPSPAPAPDAEPASPPSPSSPLAPSPMETQAPPPPSKTATKVPSASAPAASSAAARVGEAPLLERARTALTTGDIIAALAALGEHERMWPRGQLVEEREALFVVGLARSGRVDDARRRATSFAQRFPASLLLPTVQAAAAP